MRRKPFIITAGIGATALALTFATGCGSSAPAGGTAAAPAAKVKRSAEERLSGVWQGTMVVDEDSVREKVSAEKADALVEALRQQKMTIEFRADGSLTTTTMIEGKERSSDESWQHLKGEGDELTVKMISKDGKQTDHAFLFDSDDSFLMPVQTEVANLGAMRFTRQR